MFNQRGAAKPGALIKVTQALVLLLFVSLLAFSAGAYIGKTITDNEYKKAQLEGRGSGEGHDSDTHTASEHASHETKSKDTEGHEKDSGHSENLSEEDIASLTEEFVTKEKTEVAAHDSSEKSHHEASTSPSEHKSESKKVAEKETESGYKKYNSERKPASETKTKSESHESSTPAKPESHVDKHVADKKAPVSDVAQRVAEGKAPSAEVKPVAKPSQQLPVVTSTAVGKYTVQIASYAEESQAKEHAERLKKKSWNAFYVPAEIKGRPWFRVSVGLFANPESAAEFKTEFQKSEDAKDAIVQKIVK